MPVRIDQSSQDGLIISVEVPKSQSDSFCLQLSLLREHLIERLQIHGATGRESINFVNTTQVRREDRMFVRHSGHRYICDLSDNDLLFLLRSFLTAHRDGALLVDHLDLQGKHSLGGSAWLILNFDSFANAMSPEEAMEWIREQETRDTGAKGRQGSSGQQSRRK